MIEILEKIQEYANKKGLGTLSLTVENDESGFIIQNVFMINEQAMIFEFENLEELYVEIGLRS
tara:strand:- start:45 stop:233 length:189 start_codon:yes stop_codon:yes gene_type:complete